jgi:hypothetical protein
MDLREMEWGGMDLYSSVSGCGPIEKAPVNMVMTLQVP